MGQQGEGVHGEEQQGTGNEIGEGDVMEGEVTDDECSKAIRALKPGKAVGDDKVTNEMLKEGGGALWKAITFIMEAIRQQEWIPEAWRVERVTLLHKGKSRMMLDNYRGIAIGSNLGKFLHEYSDPGSRQGPKGRDFWGRCKMGSERAEVQMTTCS